MVWLVPGSKVVAKWLSGVFVMLFSSAVGRENKNKSNFSRKKSGKTKTNSKKLEDWGKEICLWFHAS